MKDNKTQPATCPNLMYEMLRSFVTLARYLNLSHAVAELGSTRQTVRRHVDTLQKIRGQTLFKVVDRQYALTRDGADALPEAENILQWAEAWLRKDTLVVDGLAAVRFESEGQSPFFAQQHPVDAIWQHGTPLIQRGLSAWVESRARLEVSEFDAVRDYFVAYRRHHEDWLCVSIGEKSSYATWLGWSWAKSAIGKPLYADPMASAADYYVDRAYSTVLRSGGVRLDHVYTRIAREHGGPPLPISYQRLLLRCVFPNGEHALVTLIDRTRKLHIVSLPEAPLTAMESEFIMETPA